MVTHVTCYVVAHVGMLHSSSISSMPAHLHELYVFRCHHVRRGGGERDRGTVVIFAFFLPPVCIHLLSGLAGGSHMLRPLHPHHGRLLPAAAREQFLPHTPPRGRRGLLRHVRRVVSSVGVLELCFMWVSFLTFFHVSVFVRASSLMSVASFFRTPARLQQWSSASVSCARRVLGSSRARPILSDMSASLFFVPVVVFGPPRCFSCERPLFQFSWVVRTARLSPLLATFFTRQFF